uniref:Uncharacterized protein n=1 Tax=viral metagenome TaxID=1070528 RepID=A0A6M3JIE3_9ZZZZ
MVEIEKIYPEYPIPQGYEPTWPNDQSGTHAICKCCRHEFLEKDADSHTCTWLFLKRV